MLRKKAATLLDGTREGVLHSRSAVVMVRLLSRRWGAPSGALRSGLLHMSSAYAIMKFSLVVSAGALSGL